jgi:hypothetical protein
MWKQTSKQWSSYEPNVTDTKTKAKKSAKVRCQIKKVRLHIQENTKFIVIQNP